MIVIALIAGMVGCVGPYNLTIASTAGGSVTTPGEGTFTYDEGEVVDLVAEAEEGYRFINWTGDVDTIAHINAAATNITMNGGYEITANFAQYTSIVAAGGWHTVGLKSGGTVVAVWDNTYGQCDVADWTNIVQVAAGGHRTVGVKTDGTVVAAGLNSFGVCDVGDWTNITQVAAGGWYKYGHTVGLRSDGTVVAAGWEAELAKWDLF